MFGVLAAQGAVTPHLKILDSLGLESISVRSTKDLFLTDRLIIPGGESTTMIKILRQSGLWSALAQYQNPIWGICAGAILLSKEVTHPEQPSLGLIETKAIRNAYGSQRESFTATIDSKFKLPPVDFIRAPKLYPLSNEVEILGSLKDEPVLMRQGRIMVSSFHIELSGDPTLHLYFKDFTVS
jgi:5'-phosphate synthase pdxT subunit